MCLYYDWTYFSAGRVLLMLVERCNRMNTDIAYSYDRTDHHTDVWRGAYYYLFGGFQARQCGHMVASRAVPVSFQTPTEPLAAKPVPAGNQQADW